MVVIAATLLLVPSPLERFLQRLEGLSSVAFSYERVLDYKTPNYHKELKSEVKALFDLGDRPPFARFVANYSNGYSTGFDGETAWNFDPKNGQLTKETKVKAEDFDSYSVLRNNVFGFAKSVRASMKLNPDAVKTFSEDDATITFHWNCGNARPTISVPLEKMQVPTEFDLVVDKQTSLPKSFTQYLEKKGDTIVTRFSNWRFDVSYNKEDFAPKGR